MPDKDKIYSRQVSAPILKRKTSRFGLGQFLGSISGASQTCTSYSYLTASNTLSYRAAYSAHPVTPSHPHNSQPSAPQQFTMLSSHTTNSLQTPCPIHSSTHNHTVPPQQHFFFSSTSHQCSSSAPVATTTTTLASSHSQSHQYLVHCVAPSQMLIHSPMPTLQEAEHQKQQTKSQPSSQSHHYPHDSTHSYHSHFQKHPSAPNLLPPPPSAPAPSPSPSASGIPLHCTCDVGCTQASNNACAPAPQGRL